MTKMDDASIVKSGYLIKLATKSGKNWKKRYFVLNGNTLTYYSDHKSLEKAKGDLLITAEAALEDTEVDGKPHCCSVITPFHTLVFAAKDSHELREWKNAIQNAIIEARTSIRGYVTKVGGFLEGKHRKFFILHTSAITWHADHEHTSSIQGMMKLTPTVAMTANDTENKIDLVEQTTNTVLTMGFEQNVHEYVAWKKGIGKVLDRYEKAEEETVQRIENAYDCAVMRGKLKVRPPKGGDDWKEHYVVLTMKELLVLEKNEDGQTEVVDMYEIFPSCSVFETNLGQHAFELVTPKKVLHVKSESRDVTAAWIQNIRMSISESEPDISDPLLQQAISKMEEDVFYDVSFHEDKPLGVVLERSGEWAIVKLSSYRETGVSIGSALSSVNGESCILQPYQFAIGKLKNWKPPLHLGFRRAPQKSGYLVKLSRQRKGGSHKNWKTRFFCLGEGRLVYKDDDSPTAALKGDVPLMGSAVALMPSTETGKFFCFRVLSGVTSLIMQAETQDEMMDWAGTLYHAIAIANGGGHIISIERSRIEEELAFEEKRQASVKTKQEAAALSEGRQKAEEEARQAREDALAAKRKADEEAAKLEAQEKAAMEEQKRLEEEAAARRERKIEEANSMLESAIQIECASTLETAVSAVEAMDVADEVQQLPVARRKLIELLEDERRNDDDLHQGKEAVEAAAEEEARKKLEEELRLQEEMSREEARRAEQEAEERERRRLEEEKAKAKAEAEAEAAAEALRAEEEMKRLEEETRKRVALEEEARKRAEASESLSALLSSPSLTSASLEDLLAAIEEAERHSAEEELLQAGREKAEQFSRQQQNEAEVRALLRAAIEGGTLPALDEALNHAESIDLEDEEVAGARELAGQWREEQLLREAEEQLRLAAEARRLDEELAAQKGFDSTLVGSDELSIVQEEGESEEEEDEDEGGDNVEIGQDAIISNRRTAPLASSHSQSFTGSPRPNMLDRRPSYADANRKLGTIKERLLEDERRKTGVAEEKTLTTDEQLSRFFHSYARVVDGFEESEPLLTPVQFSSILRMITGEKGNLFSEMKTFNRFDDDGNGFITEDEFVNGFKEMSKTNASMVDRIASLVGGSNVII